MSAGPADASNREAWIDVLRGLSATAVVLYHFNAIGPMPRVYNNILLQGHIGVAIFFAVSGYCMAEACRLETDWRAFMVSRLLRIYIPFWFSMIVICAIVGWRLVTFGTNDVTVMPKGLAEIAAHSVLLISPVTDLTAMNWVYWTLTYELAFYMVIAASLWLGAGRRALLVAVTLASLVPGISTVKLLFFLSHWGLFALGFAIASLRQRRDLFGVLLLMLSALSISLNEPGSYVFAALFFVVAALGQMLSLRAQQKTMLRMLSALGTVSYSMYLLHVPVGIFIFGWALDPSGTRGVLEAALIYAMLFSVVVAVSAVAYRLVEVPSISLGKQWGGRWARNRDSHSDATSKLPLKA